MASGSYRLAHLARLARTRRATRKATRCNQAPTTSPRAIVAALRAERGRQPGRHRPHRRVAQESAASGKNRRSVAANEQPECGFVPVNDPAREQVGIRRLSRGEELAEIRKVAEPSALVHTRSSCALIVIEPGTGEPGSFPNSSRPYWKPHEFDRCSPRPSRPVRSGARPGRTRNLSGIRDERCTRGCDRGSVVAAELRILVLSREAARQKTRESRYHHPRNPSGFGT